MLNIQLQVTMRSSLIVIFLAGLLSRVFTDDDYCKRNETFKQAAAGTCKGYWDCNNGNVTYKRCSILHSFDSEKRECVWNLIASHSVPCRSLTSPQADISWCSIGKTYKAPVSRQCNSFYDCQNGVGVIKKCWWPMKFDPNERQCRINMWPYRFSCFVDDIMNSTTTYPIDSTSTTAYPMDATSTAAYPTNPTSTAAYSTSATSTAAYLTSATSTAAYLTSTTSTATYLPSATSTAPYPTKATSTAVYLTNPTSTPSHDRSSNLQGKSACTDNQKFLKAYPGDCTKYYNCENGKLSVKECNYWQKFDPIALICRYDYPWDSVKCIVSSENSTTVPSILVTTLQPSTSPAFEEKPICLAGNQFKLPYPQDCTKYYLCSDGNIKIEKCPYLQLFNPLTHLCQLNFPWSQFNCSDEPDKPICKTDYNYRTSFPESSKLYYHCSNGALTIEECGYMHIYDESEQDCKYSIFNDSFDSTRNDALTCSKSSNYNITYPGDCHKYFNCWNQTLNTMDCPFWYKFDQSIGKCAPMTKCDLLTCNVKGPLCYSGYDYSIPVSESCDKYSECKNGSWTLRSCTWMYKFDPQMQECKFDSPFSRVNCDSEVKCDNKSLFTLFEESRIQRKTNFVKYNAVEIGSRPVCNQNQNFKAVFPDDCKKYFECNNGILTVKNCSWLAKFNPATLECSLNLPFFQVNCSAVPGSEIPKPIVYPQDIKSHCTRGVNFNGVVKNDCKAYYSCRNGTLSYKHCFPFESFNPVTFQCSLDLPFRRVNCSALPGQPTCSKNELTRKAYPGNCYKYYECRNGELSVIECGFMLKFDHKKLQCEYEFPFSKIDCNYFGN